MYVNLLKVVHPKEEQTEGISFIILLGVKSVSDDIDDGIIFITTHPHRVYPPVSW